MLQASDAVWPELLRRYLAATRSKAVAAGVTFDPSGEACNEGLRSLALFGFFFEINTLYRLLSAPYHPSTISQRSFAQPPPAAEDPVLMGDDAMALYAADHLGRAPWWELPPGAHLRLLNVLCYDVANVRGDDLV